MSELTDAIAAHRAAWQAFQDAPSEDDHPDTISASDKEAEALFSLVRTEPLDGQDLQALQAHLDWWVVEEQQRRSGEPELFVLHAALKLERERCAGLCKALGDLCKRLDEMDEADTAYSLMDDIQHGCHP